MNPKNAVRFYNVFLIALLIGLWCYGWWHGTFSSEASASLAPAFALLIGMLCGPSVRRFVTGESIATTELPSATSGG